MNIRIKELLDQKGIKSKDLAEKVGVSEQTISYTLNGKVKPSLTTLEKIADAIGVPFWQLFVNPKELGADADLRSSIQSVFINGIEYVPKDK